MNQYNRRRERERETKKKKSKDKEQLTLDEREREREVKALHITGNGNTLPAYMCQCFTLFLMISELKWNGEFTQALSYWSLTEEHFSDPMIVQLCAIVPMGHTRLGTCKEDAMFRSLSLSLSLSLFHYNFNTLDTHTLTHSHTLLLYVWVCFLCVQLRLHKWCEVSSHISLMFTLPERRTRIRNPYPWVKKEKVRQGERERERDQKKCRPIDGWITSPIIARGNWSTLDIECELCWPHIPCFRPLVAWVKYVQGTLEPVSFTVTPIHMLVGQKKGQESEEKISAWDSLCFSFTHSGSFDLLLFDFFSDSLSLSLFSLLFSFLRWKRSQSGPSFLYPT